MKLINWYISRLRTMNVQELFFRISQQYCHQLNRINKSWNVKANSNFKVNSKILNTENLPINLGNFIKIFDNEINIDKIPNWHLDLSTNKEFPKKYSFDIDIRTDKNGSAKYVWEVNKLQFLPRIAINFKQFKRQNDINLFIQHIQSWKEQNPYLIGVNWYSNVEVNIRLINWALSWEILDGKELMNTNKDFKRFVEEDWLPLIYQHCVYSDSFPSLFSSANNHLISEYAGLFIANCVWEFPESKKWIAKSQAGLEKEIQIQHSEEGINKEEAALYIQYITDFFLISYIFGNNSGHSFSSTYKNKLVEIFDYILGFLDIKGNFPQYGDEDDGRLTLLNSNLDDNNFDSILISAVIITQDNKYKLPRHIIDNKNLILFGREGSNDFESISSQTYYHSNFYPKSGHFIFRKVEQNKEIYLHFDAAPLGYLSIAAHGHSDALSIILHLEGQPMLIDSGTYTYHTHPEWRSYFTSTKAHNTVCIENTNQAKNGGPLLWINHYITEVEDWSMSDVEEIAVGSHDGYNSLGFTHRRKVIFEKNNDRFIIIDTILSEDNLNEVFLEIPWHLHPDCSVNFEEQKYTVSQLKSRKILISIDSKLQTKVVNGETSPKLGWYSKSFYNKQPTNTIIGWFKGKFEKEIVFITTIEIK